jgi:thiol-disulfide isomerase/thioredoxin
MIELTKETFDEQVLQASGKVLVDFYGDGCAPCEALMPHIHKLENNTAASSNSPHSTRRRPAGSPSVSRFWGCPSLPSMKTA